MKRKSSPARRRRDTVYVMIAIILAAAITIRIFVSDNPHKEETILLPEVKEEPESYAGRVPAKRIVYGETGQCAGVLFKDGSYDGDCAGAMGKPSIRYEDFFSLERTPFE